MNDRATTRERIVGCADALFHAGGYEHTSFATIAHELGISRGNFHYHFKTKDDILEAVIARRYDQAVAFLQQVEDRDPRPLVRIRRFIDSVLDNQDATMRAGCQNGTLYLELSKQMHPHLEASRAVFDLYRRWLRAEFERADAPGVAGGRADEAALHVLTRTQGIAVLANIYRDQSHMAREIADLHRWLDHAEPIHESSH